jgi:hypothetical protein
MKTHPVALACALALVAAVAALPIACTAAGQKDRPHSHAPRGGDGDTGYKISGPYTHKNLTVFLLHGPDRLAGKTFLTLSEALTQKKVVVYETKTVNTLAIENLSDEEVFVQSGDIVKGGQQDRMLAVDLILPARSGKVSIEAFCVEQGRWSKRGTEEVTRFSSSTDRAATKELKLAANKSRSQGEVWAKVAEAQDKLSRNVGGRVNSAHSDSSLQLALEDSRVRATTDEYVRSLAALAAKHRDAVGYAFAINGRVNSAEVYGSHALFLKLWPGLLKSSAVEALAELRKDASGAAPHPEVSAADVRAFLAESERGEHSERAVTKRVSVSTRETKTNIVFETRDSASKSVWVHRSYIKK